jgi:hypothetical protein
MVGALSGTRYNGVLLAAVVRIGSTCCWTRRALKGGSDVLNYSNAPSDISDSSGGFCGVQRFPL